MRIVVQINYLGSLDTTTDSEICTSVPSIKLKTPRENWDYFFVGSGEQDKLSWLIQLFSCPIFSCLNCFPKDISKAT